MGLTGNVMSTLASSSKDIGKWAKRNAPAILIGVGDVLWAGAAAWGIWKSPEMRDRLKKAKREEKEDASFWDKAWNRAKAVAPCLGPVAGMGIAGTTCHVLAQKESSKRLAAVVTAYAVSESERKLLTEKTKEVINSKEEKELDQKVAEQVVQEHPEVLNRPKSLPDGKLLTIDRVTGNTFYATYEDIYNASIDITKRLSTEMFIDANELYYSVDAKPVDIGSEFGFDLNTGCQIKYSIDSSSGIAVITYNWTIRPEYK